MLVAEGDSAGAHDAPELRPSDLRVSLGRQDCGDVGKDQLDDLGLGQATWSCPAVRPSGMHLRPDGPGANRAGPSLTRSGFRSGAGRSGGGVGPVRVGSGPGFRPVRVFGRPARFRLGPGPVRPSDSLLDLSHQDSEGQHRAGRWDRRDQVVQEWDRTGRGAVHAGHVQSDRSE